VRSFCNNHRSADLTIAKCHTTIPTICTEAFSPFRWFLLPFQKCLQWNCTTEITAWSRGIQELVGGECHLGATSSEKHWLQKWLQHARQMHLAWNGRECHCFRWCCPPCLSHVLQQRPVNVDEMFQSCVIGHSWNMLLKLLKLLLSLEISWNTLETCCCLLKLLKLKPV